MATTEEEVQERQAAIEAAMRADGVRTEDSAQEDYFGFDETHKCYFPDGVSYIEHKTLNHGTRKRYLNKVNRDLKINRATGDAAISMRPGDEKDELIKAAVVGWNLVRGGSPLTFSQMNFETWLGNASPKIVDILEKDIRMKNPWLMSDMSVEDMKKERDNLDDLIATKEREEEGKVS